MKRNRCQSTPEEKRRRRRRADLLPLSVEQELVQCYDNDNTDGDVRSTSRKDARKHQSAELYAAMPMSSAKVAASKETLKSKTALRQSKDDDERGKQQKNEADIT